MTQEEFFEEENKRHIESHEAYLESLDAQKKLSERTVIAQEKTAKGLERLVKAQTDLLNPKAKKHWWKKL